MGVDLRRMLATRKERRKGCVAQIESASTRAPTAVPYAAGLYITAAYWFTASTSFANPAVTIARAFSDSFAGIAPADVAAFIAAQLVGMLAAVVIDGWLWPKTAKTHFRQEWS